MRRARADSPCMMHDLSDDQTMTHFEQLAPMAMYADGMPL